jgi:hypothetical protein
MSDHMNITAMSVDEAWLVDWAAEGLAALERYLAKHAAFAEFLRKRSPRRMIDGDGAAAR